MRSILTFIATGMLTNSATHLVRIFQQEQNLPVFRGDITDLAGGGSDGFYDVGDWECDSVESLGSSLLDYMASCDTADILTPVYDPHGLLEGTARRTGTTPNMAAPAQSEQPIPRGGTGPLKVGDRVRIVPEWQDPGDENYENFVIEAPENTTRVRIRTLIPGLAIQPTEWIEADKLVLHPSDPP